MRRASQPANSPWLLVVNVSFGCLVKLRLSLNEKKISSPEELISEIDSFFSEVTFEELQKVYKEWIKRLEWVINNNGEYYIK